MNTDQKLAINCGEKKETKGLLMPKKIKKANRKLGILQGSATYTFVDGHNTNEKDFFGQ